jgi:hypothetical protein
MGTGVTADTWHYSFTWDGTSGYTIGFTHSHEKTAPSPEDILFLPSTLSDPSLADPTQAQFFKDNASITALTLTTTFVVMPQDWSILAQKYSGWQQDPTYLDAGYTGFAGNYKFTHPSASDEDASAYALLKIFGSGITLLKVSSYSNAFQVLTVDSNDNLITTPCN